MSSDDEPNVSDKVEILSTEDEKLKTIGEILSSNSSRKILELLFNQSLTANQLAQKTELSLPLVIHHLKKMQSAQVVKITNVGKNTKSHDMKYYTIDKFAIVILPSEMSQSARKSKSLFNSFTRLHRLATLGGAAIAAWFSSQFLQQNSITKSTTPAQDSEETMMRAVPEAAEEMQATAQAAEPQLNILVSLVVVLSVIISGLVVELIIRQRKKHVIDRVE